jgi:hypothetical protein
MRAVALDDQAVTRLLFASLQEHAVPLNEADLAALAHSAMALDLYIGPGSGATHFPYFKPSTESPRRPARFFGGNATIIQAWAAGIFGGLGLHPQVELAFVYSAEQFDAGDGNRRRREALVQTVRPPITN